MVVWGDAVVPVSDERVVRSHSVVGGAGWRRSRPHARPVMALRRSCWHLARAAAVPDDGKLRLRLPLETPGPKWELQGFKDTIARYPTNHEAYLSLALAMPDTEFTLLNDRRVASKIDLLQHVVAIRPDVADAYLYLAILSPWPVEVADGVVMTPDQLVKRAIALNPDHFVPYYTLAAMMAHDDPEQRNTATTTLEDGSTVTRLDLLARTVAAGMSDPFVCQLVAGKLSIADPPLRLPDGSRLGLIDLHKHACAKCTRDDLVSLLCKLATCVPDRVEADSYVELDALGGEAVMCSEVELLRKAVQVCGTREDLCATMARLADVTGHGEGEDAFIDYGDPDFEPGTRGGVVQGTKIELLKRAVALSRSNYGHYFNLAAALPSYDSVVELPVSAFSLTDPQGRGEGEGDGGGVEGRAEAHARAAARRAERKAAKTEEPAAHAEAAEEVSGDAKATTPAAVDIQALTREAQRRRAMARAAEAAGKPSRWYTKIDLLVEALAIHDSDPDVYCELANCLPSYEHQVMLYTGEIVDKLQLYVKAVLSDPNCATGFECLAAAMHVKRLGEVTLPTDGEVLSLAEVYAKAIQLNPENPANYNNLGSHLGPAVKVVIDGIAYGKIDLYIKALDVTFALRHIPGTQRAPAQYEESSMIAFSNLALTLEGDEAVCVTHFRRRDDIRLSDAEMVAEEGSTTATPATSGDETRETADLLPIVSCISAQSIDSLHALGDMALASSEVAVVCVNDNASRVDLILNAIHCRPGEAANFITLGCFLLGGMAVGPQGGSDPAMPAGFRMSQVLLLSGETVDASACFKRAIALDPSQASAYSNLALLCSASSDAVTMDDGASLSALQLIKRAIDLDPHKGSYWNNLSSLLPVGESVEVHGETFTKATLFLKAVTLSPYNAVYWANLAGACEGNPVLVDGEVMMPVDLLKRAIHLAPGTAELYFYLAMSLDGTSSGGGGGDAPPKCADKQRRSPRGRAGRDAKAWDGVPRNPLPDGVEDTTPETVLEDGTVMTQLELLYKAVLLRPEDDDASRALNDLLAEMTCGADVAKEDTRGKKPGKENTSARARKKKTPPAKAAKKSATPTTKSKKRSAPGGARA